MENSFRRSADLKETIYKKEKKNNFEKKKTSVRTFWRGEKIDEMVFTNKILN